MDGFQINLQIPKDAELPVMNIITLLSSQHALASINVTGFSRILAHSHMIRPRTSTLKVSSIRQRHGLSMMMTDDAGTI